MKYVMIKNNIVSQVQPNKQDGYIEADDNVVCGMALIDDKFYSLGKYEYIEDGKILLNIDKAKQDKIDEIRQCRSECWQKFDGLYLGYERDGNSSMILDCENLRQSLKNAPTNALSAMSDMTTLEQVESVNLCGLLTIPDSLKDYVDSYFNIS